MATAQFYPTWILKDFRRLHAVLIYNYETYYIYVVRSDFVLRQKYVEKI